jgi:lysophospholipase L1-like esterase
LAEYKDNLKRMISLIRERGVTNIVLITPPPVYEPARKEAQIMVNE